MLGVYWDGRVTMVTVVDTTLPVVGHSSFLGGSTMLQGKILNPKLPKP